MRDRAAADAGAGEPSDEAGEGAVFNFAWLTAPGTAVFVAALAVDGRCCG